MFLFLGVPFFVHDPYLMLISAIIMALYNICTLWRGLHKLHHRLFSEHFRIIPKEKFYIPWLFNTLRPRQNGRQIPDDIFKLFFLNENIGISINISLKFVSKGLIDNMAALVQIMAWRRPGDMPFYLNQWWLVYWRIYARPRPLWVNRRWQVCMPNNIPIISFLA